VAGPRAAPSGHPRRALRSRSIGRVQAINALAAVLALLVLARNGRRALALFRRPGPDAPDAQEGPGGRAFAVLPLLNCVIAGVVLWVAVKGLLPGLMNHPGGTP